MTFGFLNPSILLPARVVELDPDLREAIAHHELAHVRRRDWLFVLLEESIRSVLWFHPAIWFVLSRIQLAREQVVDAEVVGLTRDRERYLDALVAVAAQRLLPDVAPAPLFLKKRQLAVRVAAVLKETRMSKPRTFLSYTTVCSAALVAVRLAVWMFPMQAPAQTRATEKASIVADGPGVVVEPGAKILHRPPVFYPSGAETTGSVIVEATVNAKGEVTDARVISGPDEFRHAALASVLNWHFSAEGGLPPTLQSTIRFAAPPKTAAAAIAPAAHPAERLLKRILTDGLPADLAEKVLASLPVHVGDRFGSDEFSRTKAAVQEVDGHLMVSMGNTNATDVMLVVSLPPLPFGVIRTQSSGADVVGAPQRIRVGGNVQSANLIKKVTPLYPPDAKAARISGHGSLHRDHRQGRQHHQSGAGRRPSFTGAVRPRCCQAMDVQADPAEWQPGGSHYTN